MTQFFSANHCAGLIAADEGILCRLDEVAVRVTAVSGRFTGPEQKKPCFSEKNTFLKKVV